jgi:4-O-beta-D-mannosyl-D-glucose phosphorylase
MNQQDFDERLSDLLDRHQELVAWPNRPLPHSNGVVQRWQYPVLTAEHTPVFWRYDLDRSSNPRLMERMGINSVFNTGAIELDGKVLLAARVEGVDRKSFFAIAKSTTGVDGFKFWDYPVEMPETDEPDVNVYDMRLVQHQDGYIYGLFCTERKDPSARRGDLSSAVARCGIARTHDLRSWERLPDLRTQSPQQRNVVLHPELIDGKYAFYTRPQDGFIEAGSGGGICWGLSDSIEPAVIDDEIIVHDRRYHTITEVKNGLGPAPLKTPAGWLHLAHGVRGTAAGLRYVLYAFMTDLDEPWRVIAEPAGYLLAPQGDEYIGDVMNVVFANGWVARDNGELLIYYGSSDTRCHVATSTVDRLVDYCLNTPADPLTSAACVRRRIGLIEKNLQLIRKRRF